MNTEQTSENTFTYMNNKAVSPEPIQRWALLQELSEIYKTFIVTYQLGYTIVFQF